MLKEPRAIVQCMQQQFVSNTGWAKKTGPFLKVYDSYI